MSDAPSNVGSSAFADALARARQLAAKLSGGATATSPPPIPNLPVKRSAEEFGAGEPDKKRMAALNDPFGAQLAAMKGSGGGPPSIGGGMGGGGGGGGNPASNFSFPVGLGITGSGKSCTEEVRIPDGLVGLIIGRGGEQVSRIQAETGCKVQVAPDSGSGKDRPCYLQGTKEAIERAKDLIMDIVSSKSHEIGGRPAAGPAPPKPSNGQSSIEMIIPGPKVGLVIGKGGETIRSLQDKSGTKMYILQDNMFEECDKPLRIVGDPDLVEHARQLVIDLINESPPKPEFSKQGKGEYGGGMGGDGPMGGGGGGGGRPGLGFGSSGGGGMDKAGLETMRFPVPKISVGLIIGKGGEMIKRIQMETGAKVQFDPINSNLGDMDEQLAIITGKPDQLRQAQLRIEELVETALHGGKGDNQGGRGDRGGMGGGRHGGHNEWGGPGGGGGGGHNRPRDYEEERLPVPVGRVGMVIGKGGETIRAINQQSGAHCEIDRNGPQDGPERVFLIKGNRQQIEHAKELIMEKVNTLPPKGKPGGRGPGGNHHGNDPYGQNQGWGQYSQQGGGWGQQGQQDPSKSADPSAQWAAYYAQYYGQAQAAAAAAGAPGASVPGAAGGAAAANNADYTQQWIEYFRAQGQHQQADALEQQMKAAKSGGADSNNGGSSGNTPAPPGTGSGAPAPPGTTTNGQSSSSSGAAAAAVAGQNGQSADYSQQWADHYRSIGKIAEAEAIENYIKQQKAAGAGSSAAPSTTTAGATPGAGGPAAGYPGYMAAGYYGGYSYPGYPGYGSGGYPGAPAPPGGPTPPGGNGNNSGSNGSSAPPGTTGPPGTDDK